MTITIIRKKEEVYVSTGKNILWWRWWKRVRRGPKKRTASLIEDLRLKQRITWKEEGNEWRIIDKHVLHDHDTHVISKTKRQETHEKEKKRNCLRKVCTHILSRKYTPERLRQHEMNEEKLENDRIQHSILEWTVQSFLSDFLGFLEQPHQDFICFLSVLFLLHFFVSNVATHLEFHVNWNSTAAVHPSYFYFQMSTGTEKSVHFIQPKKKSTVIENCI